MTQEQIEQAAKDYEKNLSYYDHDLDYTYIIDAFIAGAVSQQAEIDELLPYLERYAYNAVIAFGFRDMMELPRVLKKHGLDCLVKNHEHRKKISTQYAATAFPSPFRDLRISSIPAPPPIKRDKTDEMNTDIERYKQDIADGLKREKIARTIIEDKRGEAEELKEALQALYDMCAEGITDEGALYNVQQILKKHSK